MKQQAGLVLALASAAPAVAREPVPEPRLLPDAGNTALLAAIANADGAEAALAEGRAYLAANNAVQAISAFRLALTADSGSVAALNGLGIAYDRLGRSDLARRHFEMALAIEPEAADIAYNLGWSLHLAGEHRAAVPWLQRASGGNDGRAAAAARRVLALIAARLEAEASGTAIAPVIAADDAAPVRVASARIDMASTGEAVLVLPGAVPHPVAKAPVLALSVPVERVITASLPAGAVDVAALDVALPELDVKAPASEAAAPVKLAEAAPETVSPPPEQPARQPAAVREVLNGRLGALAALAIPLAAPIPAVASPTLPPELVSPAVAAAPASEARAIPARAIAREPVLPKVIRLGDAPPDFADLRPALATDADVPEWADPVVPPLRLLDLAALPLLATATPVQPLSLLAPPRLAVDWLAGTDIDHLAPEADRPAYKRLMDALSVQADLADAVDPQAVRMAIGRLEALVARIRAMSMEIMSA
jgi:hypothetical protein